jgi:hypothetical protein
MKLRVWVLAALLIGFGLRAELPPAPVSGAAAPPLALAPESGTTPAGESAAPVVRDGYALLDSLLTLFDKLPVEKENKGGEGETKQTNPGILEVQRRLSQLSQDAKISLSAGQIDKVFHRRYQRMLTIFQMVITPIIRGELLKDLFMNAFEAFVWDVTCEHWSWEDKDGIAKMAAAMEEEFVQMMIYLDTRQRREELKQKIGRRILPPPPPPAKKKAEEKKPQ